MKKIFATILACICAFSASGCTYHHPHAYGVNDYRTTMEFYDGFKILQLTDLHLGIESDLQKQLSVVSNAIRTQSPDLVILTGDNFMYATKSVVDSLVLTLNNECKKQTEQRGKLTKFAITFGNHDNQGDYPRYYINSVIKSYTTTDGNEIADGKYGAFKDYEDDELFGNANYFIDLVDDRQKDVDSVDVRYRLHIIDSNSYHFTGVKYQYDVIHTDQLEHVNSIYQSATTDKDYIGLSFFHIPFEEFDTVRIQYENAQNPSEIGQGEFREHVLYPYENNGSYTKMRNANVIGFFVGHDHINYGDFIYNASSANVGDKALFSYGVKTTNQLYHETDMIGYKTITLKDGMSQEEFLSVQNLTDNFSNETAGITIYE